MKVYVLTSAFHTCEESEQRIVGVYRDKTKALTAFHTEIERIKNEDEIFDQGYDGERSVDLDEQEGEFEAYLDYECNTVWVDIKEYELV